MYAKNQFDWLSLKFRLFLTTYQLLRAVKLSEKNFDFRNCLMVYGSSFVPNLSSFARLHQTIPVGWLVGWLAVGGWLVGRGEWGIMQAPLVWFLEFGN